MCNSDSDSDIVCLEDFGSKGRSSVKPDWVLDMQRQMEAVDSDDMGLLDIDECESTTSFLPVRSNETSGSSGYEKKTLSSSAGRKRKSLDQVRDIHETTTDELDSDDEALARQSVIKHLAAVSKQPSLPSTSTFTSVARSAGTRSPPSSSTRTWSAICSAKKPSFIRDSSDSEIEVLPDVGQDEVLPGPSASPPLAYAPVNTTVRRDGDGGNCPLISDSSDSDQEDLRDLDDDPIPASSSWNCVSSGSSATTASEVGNNRARGRCRVLGPKGGKKDSQGQKAVQKKADAEKLKEAKRLEKERKMEEEQRAKELRKVTSEVQKSTKPGESFKYMTAVLSSSLSDKFDGLVPVLVAAEVKHEVDTDPVIENSISFKREVMQQAMGDDLKIRVTSNMVDEDQIIVVMESDEVMRRIHSQLYNLSSDGDGEGDDLKSWVNSVKAICAEKRITLFLYDLDKHYKKIRKNTQQEFRNRVLQGAENQNTRRKKRAAAEMPEITPNEVQSALVEMQLSTGVSYRMIKSHNELAQCVVQYTKAIADAPYKKQRLESHGFDWFALLDSAGSVKVEKDGSGLKRLWIDQLQQFAGVGSEMATAIANRYTSPLQLLEAYKECSSHEEGQSLLKDLTVTVGVGPLARTRKLGPEASKKMYRFFSSTNGDRFLGSTQDSR